MANFSDLLRDELILRWVENVTAIKVTLLTKCILDNGLRKLVIKSKKRNKVKMYHWTT